MGEQQSTSRNGSRADAPAASKPPVPGESWERIDPDAAGFAPAELKRAQSWLSENAGDRKYGAVVVRGGCIAAEWYGGMKPEDALRQASAAKSVYACVLGIAVAEGVIKSADDQVVDYYPAMMDVPPGEGPKEGRHAFPKDRELTFRQLISNTSGYMKPGEEPGKVFHYQTFGMNVLCHAVASAYGLYDVSDPEGSPGFRRLIDEKVRRPIGGSWGHQLTNFKLHDAARLPIFGYYTQLCATARDMARLGWLWRHLGRWGAEQVVPGAWLQEATRTAPAIRKHCPEEKWCYGYGFWTNDHGKLWPHLPRDSFAASGAGRKHVWVSPGLDLVVVQCPGIYDDQRENDTGLTRMVVDALR